MKRPVFLRVLGTLADQVLSVGAVFVANIALARTQSAAEYGAFALTYSVFTLLSGIHNGLLLEAFTVYGSGRYRVNFDGYWKFALKLNWAVSFVLAALVAAFTVLLMSFPALGSVRSYAVLAVALPVLLTSMFVRRVLYVEGKNIQAGVIAAIFFSLVVVCLWACSRLMILDGATVLAILAVSWLLASLVFFWRRFGGLLRTDFIRKNPAYLSQHWQYSKWVLLTALIFQMTTLGYFWLAAFFLNIASVAELRAAWNIVQPAALVFSSMSLIMLPRLANLYQQGGAIPIGAGRQISLYLLSALTIAAACSGLLWLFGDLVYSVIYAGKYDGSVDLLYVMTLTTFAAGIAGVFGDALRAAERPGMIFYAYVVGGLLTLGIGIPAISFYGVSGAAWSMVASNSGFSITIVLCYWWVSRRRASAMS